MASNIYEGVGPLLDAFAANTPTPGGGSASALAAATGAALLEMVAGLTIKRKATSDMHREEATRLLAELGKLRKSLTEAIEADALAFEGILAANKMPAEEEEEKVAREAAIQKATKAATMAPLGVAKRCGELLRIGARLLQICNPNAQSDAAVGVVLSAAGAEGALFNVAVNLPEVKDTMWAEAVALEARGIAQEVGSMRVEQGKSMAAAGLG